MKWRRCVAGVVRGDGARRPCGASGVATLVDGVVLRHGPARHRPLAAFDLGGPAADRELPPRIGQDPFVVPSDAGGTAPVQSHRTSNNSQHGTTPDAIATLPY